MNQERADIVIVGAGVIGLACALELSQRGASVTLIDKGDPGFGCSYGNAGWITPCFSMPLPMPGMFLKSIGWLMNPSSPLYIKPEPKILLFRWLLRFLFSMNQKQFLASVRALTDLSKFSFEAYSNSSSEMDSGFSFEQKGLLMVAQSTEGLKYSVNEMKFVAEHGVAGRELSPDEVRAFEPSIRGKTTGAVFFPNEAHVEPMEIVQSFVQKAKKNGVKILPRTEVIDFQVSGKKVKSIRTTKGVLSADQFVLSTGSWSWKLSKWLGLNVPILGGKGYSVITKSINPSPQRPMMLIDRKVAITPRQGSLKLAGTLELVDRDDSITPHRVDTIIRGARELLNLPDPLEYSEIWRGLRPCTPDGVPIIGYSKNYDNLMIATGHQMLGLQSAPGTGRLVGDLVFKTTPTFNPAPFRASRF